MSAQSPAKGCSAGDQMKRQTYDRDWQRRMARIRSLREKMLFAIEVHGARALHDHSAIMRWMIKHDRFGLQLVKLQLLDQGLTRAEVEDLFGNRHAPDCACWKCIFRLQMQVIKHRISMLDHDEEARQPVEGPAEGVQYIGRS